MIYKKRLSFHTLCFSDIKMPPLDVTLDVGASFGRPPTDPYENAHLAIPLPPARRNEEAESPDCQLGFSLFFAVPNFYLLSSAYASSSSGCVGALGHSLAGFPL